MDSMRRYFEQHQEEAATFRRDLHAHPELGLKEFRTSDAICRELDRIGIPYEKGLAGTGIVATLKAGQSPAVIGLRADMDALPIHEQNSFGHASIHTGMMHACGHDGHVAMLLSAARYLAEVKPFDGTVHFIFQPAEEGPGGARIMIEEGLFTRFPMDRVFGLHNMPGYEAGSFAVRPGPLMAGRDSFEVTVRGVGGHAAIPQRSKDPVVAAAALVGSLQTIASRTIDPVSCAVLSVTMFHAGDTHNVIPEVATLGGSIRYFDKAVQADVKQALYRIVEGVAATYGCTAEISYEEGYPPTVNEAAAAALVADVMGELAPADKIDLDPKPMMGAEDFAYMLQERPGCYAWIGNGPGEGGCFLHNPNYDFNDALLVTGPSFWVRLVERALPQQQKQ